MLLIMACHDWSGEPLRAQLHRLQTTKTTQHIKLLKLLGRIDTECGLLIP